MEQTLTDTAEQFAAFNIRAKQHRGTPLKSWYILSSMHDSTAQKTVFIIVPFMRMLNTTKKKLYIVFFKHGM
jgi:hypothetical protein